MNVGDLWNWKGQSERLVYIGMCEPINGLWFQFALVDGPSDVWCEVQPHDMHHLEQTAKDGVTS